MQQIGELFKNLPIVKKALKEAAPLTTAQEKLLDAATAIRLDPDAVERAYMARQLVQCTLPHSNPGDVPAWTRRNGNQTLGIQPGWNHQKNCSWGYPYGTVPRLLLFWVTTEAVQTKTRRLELGNSLAAFMRQLGLDPGRGGKRSDATRLRNQMERLFRCHISFDQVGSRGDGAQGEGWLDMQVAPHGEYWWSPKHPEQGALWGSWIELGEKFFEAVTAAPVPADMRALRALRRSPLALDLYAWATYRAFSVSRKGVPQFVPWRSLMRQMGCDYDEVRNFKKKANKALRKVRSVYPALKIKNKPGGFDILPCAPAVPPAIKGLVQNC
jgi:hypothetical protein